MVSIENQEERKVTFAEFERELENERVRQILESAKRTCESIDATIVKTEKTQERIKQVSKDCAQTLRKVEQVERTAAAMQSAIQTKIAQAVYGQNFRPNYAAAA